MAKEVILTGLRANNDLHIGNYFGALLPFVDMAKNRADDFELNLFVPDLHSFTTPIDHGQLQAQILHNLKLYVAAGLPLDHPNIHIYRQSYVPAHSELTWILDCFTGFGQMSRMTQFKDKSAKLDQDGITVGLFNYPVLMAADILLYGASYVPVGDDQTQHLEFARDIAERMNSKFGDLFTVPKPVKEQHAFFGKDQGLRIMDLVDPTKKMSKSDDTGRGVIFLGDTPEVAAKKLKSATTDSFGLVDLEHQDQPGIRNLLQVYALASGQPLTEVTQEAAGQTQYGPLKEKAANAVAELLHSFQERLAAVDEAQLLAKLEADEKQMNETANRTLARTQRAVGLRPAIAPHEEDSIVAYRQTLHELGIENEAFDHPSARSISAVMKSLNRPVDDSLSTLILKADDHYIAAVIRGAAAKANYDKIKAALSISDLRMATAEEFTAFTGLPVGAAQVYTPGALTLIDTKVLEKPYLMGGTGRFDCTLQYKTEDLRKIPGAKVLDIVE